MKPRIKGLENALGHIPRSVFGYTDTNALHCAYIYF